MWVGCVINLYQNDRAANENIQNENIKKIKYKKYRKYQFEKFNKIDN